MILGGDIGGTKFTLTLFAGKDLLRPVFRFSGATADCNSVKDLLDRFIAQAREAGHSIEGTLTAAAFGVAGTVADHRVVSNNLPWPVERRALADGLNLDYSRTLLLNDLVASASSLAHLAEEDLFALNRGRPEPCAPKVLIAAGTGLGEAILFWDGSGYAVSPSEASLTDFAPRNDREILLLQALRQRLPRACCEDIVSGRGFRLIHEILFPEVGHAWIEETGAASRITQQALAGSCSACVETLQVWTELYGAEAGNMALRLLAFGGVYVAGGIALKILPKLKDGSFVRAFTDKGNLGAQLARIPIYVVLNEDAPVIGAAQAALALARGLE